MGAEEIAEAFYTTTEAGRAIMRVRQRCHL